MNMPTDDTQALFAAISQAGTQMTQGWMRLLAGAQEAGTPVPWLSAHSVDGERLAALNASYLEQQGRLWRSLLEAAGTPVVRPASGDRRFAAREWRDNPYYDYIRQSYLLMAKYVSDLADGVRLEGAAQERLRFAVRQWADAMCPANFAATNPDAIRRAIESNGESIVRGIANLIADARRGRISQTDESAFEVGVNVASAPGGVVFENELIQLLQYAPSTAKVGKRPLVMVPPCINKFYILDLQPENSFVRYAVAAGHTVFMVSWRNVGPELGHLTWDDYLDKGIFAAFDAAREIARCDQVNALGFCVGGTLLGAALAVLAGRGEDIVASATYLTTMLDFAEPGQIGLFVDEASLAARERAIGNGGIFPGSDLAFMFSALRANDLIWPYVVNNYLMGGTPSAFDLLYWNSDSTNLPGPMYCYYVRNTYLENRLREPGALVNCGEPVDLGKVSCPGFILATREDHIVPWRAAYRSLALLGGEKIFTLGASGHVAGVVNPAAKNRRSYWTGGPYPDDPEAWLAQTTERPGSWWPRWAEWLEAFKGGERKAPAGTGSRKHRAGEPAPGRYVKERAPAVGAPVNSGGRAAASRQPGG